MWMLPNIEKNEKYPQDRRVKSLCRVVGRSENPGEATLVIWQASPAPTGCNRVNWPAKIWVGYKNAEIFLVFEYSLHVDLLSEWFLYRRHLHIFKLTKITTKVTYHMLTRAWKQHRKKPPKRKAGRGKHMPNLIPFYSLIQWPLITDWRNSNEMFIFPKGLW